jgi:hypothetical protein
MFHIFRWRREHRNENSTPSDPTVDQGHKKSHLQRHRLRVYDGRQSFERLFHIRRHRSSSDYGKRQVIKTELFTITP